MQTGEVLERKVIHAGQIFIKAGEEHARAYVVQNGLIHGFVMEGDHKIIVAKFGSGHIIGETCLMVDEPMTMNYEAVDNTTVITITRQDFQKKISRIDKDITKILNHVMNKLNYQDLTAIDQAKENAAIDSDAEKLFEALTGKLSPDKKHQYQKEIMPHVNAMIKGIKTLKEEDKKDIPTD